MIRQRTKYHSGFGLKKGIGACFIVFGVLVFILALFPSFLHIGQFFLGVFGFMTFPLCVLLALVGAAYILGLRYSFSGKFTAYLIVAFLSILCLLHAVFSSKLMLETYKKIGDMGGYLSALYHLEGGTSVGGLLMGILVFLLRALLGVGGTYVVFAILATVFIGLIIDFLIYSKNKVRKPRPAREADQSTKVEFDDKSGISTDEYSFKNSESSHTFAQLEDNEEPLFETTNNDLEENLLEPDSSLGFSFDESEEKTEQPNPALEEARSVLFGDSAATTEPQRAEQPKSAREILYGDAPTIPNIFDRSSDERDAWRRQYASKTLGFSEEEPKEPEQPEKPEQKDYTFDKPDDGVVKTSWGEYRPTSSFSSNSSVDSLRRDRGLADKEETKSEAPLVDRNSSSQVIDRQKPERNIIDRQADSAPERTIDRPERASRVSDGIRNSRERTSLSNFSRESDTPVEESNEFGSRLTERRGSSDILANASSLGIKSGGFTSAPEKPVEQPRVAPRENFSRQMPGKYTPPPTNLLSLYKEDHEDYSAEYKAKSEILESTLSAFKIPAKVINVVRGPKVTRYELSMPIGIPVTKILSYERDMAMNLASKSGVRIEAPIPGKNAFGVEVENAKSSMVGLRELVESQEFINFKAPLAVAVGKSISGEVVVKSLSRMVHLLVAGSTGSGKSVFLHALIMSLMYKYSPDELRFIMVDPKRVEFPRYNGMPHLMLPQVVNECSKAVNALSWAVKEMERRYELLEKNRCQKIEAFNECAAVKNGEEKKLPYLVIVIDELAELMSSAKKEVEGKIQRITQLGRAAGIHMVVATQRPSVDVITGVIKNNLPTRVALSLSSAIDSMTVINQGGAEKLLGHGDMLLSAQDSNQIVRLQGAFVSDEEIDKTLDFIKAHNECVWDEEIQNTIYAEPEPEEAEDEGEGGGSGEREMDELMPQALKLVMKNGKASISMVQRRFSVGYARAARIIDQMETHGFIDGGLGNKPRDVKITIEEYNELFGNYDSDN